MGLSKGSGAVAEKGSGDNGRGEAGNVPGRDFFSPCVPGFTAFILRQLHAPGCYRPPPAPTIHALWTISLHPCPRTTLDKRRWTWQHSRYYLQLIILCVLTPEIGAIGPGIWPAGIQRELHPPPLQYPDASQPVYQHELDTQPACQPSTIDGRIHAGCRGYGRRADGRRPAHAHLACCSQTSTGV